MSKYRNEKEKGLEIRLEAPESAPPTTTWPDLRRARETMESVGGRGRRAAAGADGRVGGRAKSLRAGRGSRCTTDGPVLGPGDIEGASERARWIQDDGDGQLEATEWVRQLDWST